MTKIIEANRVVKNYEEGNEERNVIDDVSLHINDGEFVSVMGPSGSGKSTLLFALSGTDHINSGKVLFNHKDLAIASEKELSHIRRKEMGFVFQQPTMLKNLNIIDNIILPALRDNRKNLKNITQKARELMKRVGIAHIEERNITQVSGGQLQRASICRSLMNSPKIIFGDEPTGALNSQAAAEIMDIFTEINNAGTAIMLVTHDSKVAARTERIMFMQDGKIVSEIRLPKYNGTNIEERVKMVTIKMREIGI